MCFSIPLKILKIKDRQATVEGNQIIMVGGDLRVKIGEYLLVTGNIAVGKLTEKEGLKVRGLIKSLN